MVGKKRRFEADNETLVRIEFQENDNFLAVVEIPEILTTRASVKKLFIRTCYPEIMADIVATLRKIKVKNVAVTGTAGIGKSSFSLFCLNEYLKKPAILLNNTEDKSFYYQSSAHHVYFFRYKEDFGSSSSLQFTLRSVSREEITDSRFPLFADIKEQTSLPIDHAGPILIFSSFQPGRYKEIIKEGSMKIMPTWDDRELQEYIFSGECLQNENLTAEDQQTVLNNSRYLGGVPRSNIICCIHKRSPEEYIGKAIREKGEDIVERFYSTGFGGTEDAISDILIHRNPLKDERGNYIYECLVGDVDFMFASPYVLVEISKLRNKAILCQAREKYKNGLYRGGEDGKDFEMHCFHTFKFSGEPFTLKPLVNTQDLEETQVTFPIIEYLPVIWKNVPNAVKPDILYLPRVGNLESGDGFCVMEMNGQSTLFILQCTIAENHPVKMNGIVQIYDCYVNNSDVNIDHTVIVFVIPEAGKLQAKQPLTTKKNTVATNIPDKIRSVTNHQYKLVNQLGNYTNL